MKTFSISLILIFEFFSVVAYGQCKIQFVLKDHKTSTPLNNVTVYEKGIALGTTDEKGRLTITNHVAGFCAFKFKRNNYEVWDGYSINVHPDTTITSPPISLHKLSELQDLAFDALLHDNTEDSRDLYKRLIFSYDELGDTIGKYGVIAMYNKRALSMKYIASNGEDKKNYVVEEDRKVVREAIKNLEFDFGKATIRDHSKLSLDKVAELLINKNFSLKLAGHADNVGSADANMKLSKDRAEAIKAYLVSKGANASHIEAAGYGKTQPIATNKTANGRQLNRRVEFTLY